MPHVPWQYLPDERRYRRQANDAIPGLSNQSFKWQSQLDVLLQRHFLQTGFADHELQDLWKHLKDEGMWDKSLIVVAADHGVAFPKARERRRLTRANAGEIAPVPLFIKAPGQKTGKVDQAWVSTIDILPTIFDVLNLNPRVKMDGRSAYSKEVRDRDTLHILQRNTFEELNIPVSEFVPERQRIIERNHALLGTGDDGPGRLYRIGPHQELLGKSPQAEGLQQLDVDFAYAGDYDDVDPSSPFVPAHVVGHVQGGGDGGRDVAVAVNGKIVGVGETFTLALGDEGELVSVDRAAELVQARPQRRARLPRQLTGPLLHAAQLGVLLERALQARACSEPLQLTTRRARRGGRLAGRVRQVERPVEEVVGLLEVEAAVLAPRDVARALLVLQEGGHAGAEHLAGGGVRPLRRDGAVGRAVEQHAGCVAGAREEAVGDAARDGREAAHGRVVARVAAVAEVLGEEADERRGDAAGGLAADADAGRVDPVGRGVRAEPADRRLGVVLGLERGCGAGVSGSRRSRCRAAGS